MATPKVVTIDYETDAIDDRPNYPPEPVGVAIQPPGERGFYMAWGHPEGNNCTKQEAYDTLLNVWRSGYGVLMHHMKFDLAVSYERMGLPKLDWSRAHDTMYLNYLLDPHCKHGGLKELAEAILNWPPDERDEVREWVWQNRERLTAQYGGKITRAKKGPNSAGAWISKAPGTVVAPYAIGDVHRTSGLFEHYWPQIERWSLQTAYDRERQVLPIFMENERVGVRVDVAGLEAGLEQTRRDFAKAEDWLRRRLNSSGLNFDADQDVAQELLRNGVVLEADFKETAGGDLSMSKDNLHPRVFQDQEVARALGYRNRLLTAMRNFMEPWHEQAVRRGDGHVSTNWNLTRNPEGGTRTGRPSTSNPNLLNISKDFEGRPDGYEHPAHLGVSPLPLVRKFILPDEGHVFCHRDFNGQELRVFAHFERGKLWLAYDADPSIDVHAMVKDDILRLFPGIALDRTKVKIINFRTIYGSGVPGLARSLMVSQGEAKLFKRAHSQALPGMADLNDGILRVVRRGEPIRTWGGRIYFPEPPSYSKKFKKIMDWEYKLMNYLIQGSAADITKQAMIDWDQIRDPATRFLVQVYDEINISSPVDIAGREMAKLKDVMNQPRLTVPMLSEGKWGYNWGSLEKTA